MRQHLKMAVVSETQKQTSQVLGEDYDLTIVRGIWKGLKSILLLNQGKLAWHGSTLQEFCSFSCSFSNLACVLICCGVFLNLHVFLICRSHTKPRFHDSALFGRTRSALNLDEITRIMLNKHGRKECSKIPNRLVTGVRIYPAHLPNFCVR